MVRHRAQRDALDAIDTVERSAGGEREVIVVSVARRSGDLQQAVRRRLSELGLRVPVVSVARRADRRPQTRRNSAGVTFGACGVASADDAATLIC